MDHPDDLLTSGTPARERRRKWFKKKRPVWHKYILGALLVAIFFAIVVYVIGENLAAVDH